MRDYGKVSPTFWTGDTGRKLRAMGPEVQLVALYLLTGPSSNMIGLYYLPIPTLCHETGLTFEGASKALRRAFEGGFSEYDRATETVWIPEMARYQIGETLSPKDNRHKAVIKDLELHRKSPFYKKFRDRYEKCYRLPPGSPFEAPSKPLRSQEQEQEQEQESNTTLALAVTPKKAFSKPTVEEVQAYCQERSNAVDPQTFVDFYESKGWMVGKNPMKDWRACVRTWEKNSNGNGRSMFPSHDERVMGTMIDAIRSVDE